MSGDPTPTVLLAEDEPLVRLVVADVLIEAGFRVIEAANAAEALAILDAGLQIDVLLTDVDMPPAMNGYELAREARSRVPDLEILIVSGRHWPGEGDLPAGAAFIAKPCANDLLVSHVRSAVERARARRLPEVPGGEVVPFPRKA